MASVRPLPGGSEALELSAAYLSGEAPELGAGVAGDDLSTGGDAWSVSADGLLLDNRLRLRGEYARSAYDFDGAGGEGAERDHGYSLLASYRPWLDKQIGGSYIDWNLGAEYKRLGTFFRSPANPGAVADRQVERLFSDLVWGEWGLQAALAQERDNVEGIAALPRIRTRHGGFNLNYTPAPAYDAQGMPETGWLGQPSYSLTANLQTQLDGLMAWQDARQTELDPRRLRTAPVSGAALPSWQTGVTLSDLSRGHLQPGRGYWWRVLAIGADGRLISQSMARRLHTPSLTAMESEAKAVSPR
ncbi:MAG: hypothetical protein AB2813_08720 [Candidatus Sedimenticola endophacoides]